MIGTVIDTWCMPESSFLRQLALADEGPPAEYGADAAEQITPSTLRHIAVLGSTVINPYMLKSERLFSENE